MWSVQRLRQSRREGGQTFYCDVPGKEYTRQTSEIKPELLCQALGLVIVFHHLEASFVGLEYLDISLPGKKKKDHQ